MSKYLLLICVLSGCSSAPKLIEPAAQDIKVELPAKLEQAPEPEKELTKNDKLQLVQQDLCDTAVRGMDVSISIQEMENADKISGTQNAFQKRALWAELRHLKVRMAGADGVLKSRKAKIDDNMCTYTDGDERIEAFKAHIQKIELSPGEVKRAIKTVADYYGV